MKLLQVAAALAFTLVSFTAPAQNYPAPRQGEWIAKDFKFHTGEVMPELRIGYTTVGEPSGHRSPCCARAVSGLGGAAAWPLVARAQ